MCVPWLLWARAVSERTDPWPGACRADDFPLLLN